jgi:CubicO group peptidase (beta-lactamase class C family)
MSKHRVPGVSVLGIEERRIAWEKHLGIREAGKASLVDASTVFEVASMTKVLAAHAALKLAEQGKLDLDKPLSSYLPAPYLEGEPQHGKITARMVLSHTTGFPNWRPKGSALKVLHTPGTKFGYSGEGFLFLQRVIEHISGEDYEPFMQRALLQPLGMKHSSHVWQETFTATAAAGHDDDGRLKPDRKLYTKPNAAYTLYCTPRDYAAFVLEMMNPNRAAAHSLSAESVRAMLTPASPPTDKTPLTRRGSQGATVPRFGLGWLIESTASGVRSYVEFDPMKGHGLIVMTNSTRGDDLWRDLLGHIGVP